MCLVHCTSQYFRHGILIYYKISQLEAAIEAICEIILNFSRFVHVVTLIFGMILLIK